MARAKTAPTEPEFPGAGDDRTLGGAIREGQFDALVASYNPAPDPTPAPETTPPS